MRRNMIRGNDKIMRVLKAVHLDKRGVEAMEYMLIGALVIGIAIAAYKILGDHLKTAAGTLGTGLNNAITTGMTPSGN